MWSARTKLLSLLAFAVTGVVFASATSLMNARTANDRQDVQSDELLVYQNGFCQVFQTLHLQVSSGQASFVLPSGVLLDTLRLAGVDLVQILSHDASEPFAEGDRVRVTTTRDTFDGNVVSLDPYLALATENGTRLIEKSQVVSIELVDAAPIAPGRVRVQVQVDEADGDYEVLANYLLRGLSWSAHHRIEVDSGLFETWIAIAGSPGITTEKLRIVSGSPRFVMSSSSGSVFAGHYDARMEGLSSDKTDWNAGQLDEYHEYALARPVSIPEGRELRLALFEGQLDLSHANVGRAGLWDGAIAVQHEWTFTNPLDEPLPAGVTSLYRDGRFIGQDRMAYLPRDEETTLVSGSALDIPASMSTRCESTNQRWFEFELTNRKSETIEVRIVLSLPERSVLTTGLVPATYENEGEHAWTFELGPGQTDGASGSATVPYDC